jgi:HEPN domain-containing protein
MNVQISKKAILFFKALEDVWAAEQIWYGSPNIAAWNCVQAAEKIMKGFLLCFNEAYDFGHDLKPLLESVESIVEVSPDATNNIMYLNDFNSRLRYKHMSTDPSPEEARVAIERTKQIMQEFGKQAGG